jgi:hypothetical protein
MGEVFYVAAEILAIGNGPLKDRVADAFYHIFMKMSDPDRELPPAIAREYKLLRQRLTGVDADGDEGSIRASCANLWDDEAKELAEKIFALFNDITRWDAVEEFKEDGEY